jgi:AraC family transcriptional regulator of adaptative response/methylated-DNA-[protein]-cysteine methyltransferase
METQTLPPEPVMLDAFLTRDASFDGIFFTAVHTTGIFCRTTCPARKPRPENVSFYPTPREALVSGFRPCKRCRPMEFAGETPAWLRPLLDEIDADPSRRWSDQDVRTRGLSPERVRRWFRKNHGMTFHAYSRARRLGSALGRMKAGSEVTRAAFDTGYESLSGFHEAFRQYFGANPTTTTGAEVIHVDRVATPLGPMLVGAGSEALCLLEFVDRRALPNQIERIRTRLKAVFVPGSNEVVVRAAAQIAEYFEGRRNTFDLPLAPAGTPFQREVWDALCAIPFGETRSYAELARSIGRPAAVRAVGKANGDNALAIVVPCHRVVGADGRLVGYGGGLWRKKRLLELERGVAV